jgi:hypothetical protein
MQEITQDRTHRYNKDPRVLFQPFFEIRKVICSIDSFYIFHKWLYCRKYSGKYPWTTDMSIKPSSFYYLCLPQQRRTWWRCHLMYFHIIKAYRRIQLFLNNFEKNAHVSQLPLQLSLSLFTRRGSEWFVGSNKLALWTRKIAHMEIVCALRNKVFTPFFSYLELTFTSWTFSVLG